MIDTGQRLKAHRLRFLAENIESGLFFCPDTDNLFEAALYGFYGKVTTDKRIWFHATQFYGATTYVFQHPCIRGCYPLLEGIIHSLKTEHRWGNRRIVDWLLSTAQDIEDSL